MTDKLNYVMGEYLKFYGIVRFEKFRLQTHIVLFLPTLIAGEAEGEKDLIIPGDLRAVQREPFRYPFLSAAVLMAQPALLDVAGLMFLGIRFLVETAPSGPVFLKPFFQEFPGFLVPVFRRGLQPAAGLLRIAGLRPASVVHVSAFQLGVHAPLLGGTLIPAQGPLEIDGRPPALLIDGAAGHLPSDMPLPGRLFVPAQGRLVVCLDAHAPAVHLADRKSVV